MVDEYVYCHGTKCHKKHTQDRIRGVKGSKVLRTKKIKVSNYYNKMYQYFCSQGCYDDFANANMEQIIAIAPRTEPLETPIEVTKEKVISRWNPDHSYIETRITECDNNDNSPRLSTLLRYGN
jgi:YHS domain-containing protein